MKGNKLIDNYHFDSKILSDLELDKFEKKFLYFYVKRTENLTDDDELEVLREKIMNDCKVYGNFEFLFVMDSERFDGIGYVLNHPEILLFLQNCWKFFYGFLCFFSDEEIEWEFFKKTNKESILDNKNVYGIKFLTEGFCKFTLTKDFDVNTYILTSKK